MFKFACGSVEGLTLIQKRETLKALKESIKAELSAKRAQKMLASAHKAIAKQERQANAIAKAQAKLDKLLAKQAAPVGAKAIKANKKPGKVVTYGTEDNAIASAIMAKKRSV